MDKLRSLFIIALFLPISSNVYATTDHGIFVSSTVAKTACEADNSSGTSCVYAQGGNHMCTDGSTKNFWYHTSSPNPNHYYGFCNNAQCPTSYAPAEDGVCLIEEASWSGYKTTTLSYDAQGRLEAVTGPFGHVLGFTYDGANRVTNLTDPGGNTYTYQYDGYDNLVSVTKPGGTTRQYVYDTYQRNALTGIVDENGNRYATWAYDVPGSPLGRAVLSEHAGGAGHLELTYNSDGTTTVTDALGGIRTYTFVTQNGAAKTSQIAGDQCASCGNRGQQAITYDGNGFIASVTDWAGNVTNYVNNDRGLQISRTEAVGTPQERTITTSWHADFRLPVSISEPGRTNTFTYDNFGHLLTRTEVDTATSTSRTTTYTYNSAGLLASVDGPRTDVVDQTTYTYDGTGNRATQTNALGQVTNFTSYDSSGRLLSMTDPNGGVTTFSYDAIGRLQSRTTDGAVTTFTYDGVGNLLRITAPDSSYLDYSYDAAHRLISIADSVGNHIDYTLDAAGNRVGFDVYDDQGTLQRTRTHVYNNLSRLVQTLGAQSQSTSFAYDGNGNRIAVTDPLNRVTSQAYDALNRLISSTDPSQGNTTYTYDARGNLASVSDPRGQVTSYSYDGFDNLIQQVSPETGTTTYTYDNTGNRTSKTDARGVTTTYTYDALNRLLTKSYPNPSLGVTYVYDQGTHGVGKLTSMTDASGTTTYSYDSHGNRLSESRTILGINYITHYVYDAADQLMQITYPSGRTLSYTRDSADRIISVSTTLGATTTPIASAISYLPFGDIKSMTLGNGISVTLAHDQDYQLTGRTDKAVQSSSYTYNAIGKITGITNNLDSARTQSFTYDAMDRLTGATGIYGTLNYTYDALGNRLSAVGAGGTDTYAYASSSNQLLSISGPHAASYSYDTVGNTTQAGPNTYLYDNSNRLEQATVNNQTTQYDYNADGERVIKTDATGNKTVYHYDLEGNLLAETDNQGTTLREYVYLNGQRLSMIDGGNVYYFHANHLDTPQLVTDSTAQVVWKADYEPFGKVNQTVSTVDQMIRFPGQYYDQETGLHYNYYRYYDPETGRYITSDPVGLDGGLNTYAYVNSNPLRYSDPFGLRDVVAVVWDSQYLSSSSPGHVFIGEMNGEYILSSFPLLHDYHSPNTTMPWTETLILEDREPTAIFKIFVPDDSAFNLATDIENDKRWWDWAPKGKDETNCTVSAYRTLTAGKVNISEPWFKPWSPNDFLDEMIRMSGRAGSGVTRLQSVPW